MPTPVLRDKKSKSYWLRKRVPARYRDIVGRGEVWRSLDTEDERIATVRCASLSLEFETEWEKRFEARRAGLPDPVTQDLPATALSPKQAFALAGEYYREYVEKHGNDPSPAAYQAAEAHKRKSRPIVWQPNWQLFAYWDDILGFLERKRLRLDTNSQTLFVRAFFKARGHATVDLVRGANGDFSPSPHAASYPPPEPEKLDALTWFDRYAEAAGLAASTLERWRPVIKEFTDWAKDSNLAKVTKKQVIDWKNALLQQDVRIGREVRKRAPRTVKDVHLAALKAICQYLVDEDKLAVNPVAGVVVRNVETEKDDDEKGFCDKDARTILAATLQKGSHLLSVEMTAARRWIPWICAYTGARVNEITSLLPSDIVTVQGILCFSLPKERSKGKRKRIVPIHSHLIEQGLRAYVAERKKLGMPLFYDPARSRGGKGANPHYQKVGERLAEWVRTLPVDHNVWPNHGWRHRWKSQSRDVGMHAQVADFIQGHGSGSVSEKYGAKWPKTLKRAVEMIPRYRIDGCRSASHDE
ncbi:integrase [Bradyrhizobium sp. S3.9.1]